MNFNTYSTNDLESAKLTSAKIDHLIRWLKFERLRMEDEKGVFIFAKLIKVQPKKTRGKTFYYLDFRVADQSMDFLERRFRPFVIRENRSYKVHYIIGTCVKCESTVDFRIVFDNDPGLAIDKEYKLENTAPVEIIDRQIAFLEKMKITDSLLRRIVYKTHTPLPSLRLDLDIDPKLNLFQKKAVRKAIQSQDFYLVLGPPGTGKTTIIREMCRLFAERGERVLLTSWMNVAVDNALGAVLKEGTLDSDHVCRIGAGDYKIAEEILPISLSGNLLDMRKTIKKAKVVGSTLASAYKTKDGIDPPFDVVIVDEAGTSNVPQTLFALGLAKKFILIGDHLQLPPIISGDNVEDWIKESLFEKLWKMYPLQHTMLKTQYRMAPEIAKIASDNLYALLGGIETPESVSKRATPFDNIDMKLFANRVHKKLVDPKSSVCWLHTIGETNWINSGPSHSANNIEEIENINKVLPVLIDKGNIDPTSIGVLSPFRYQVSTMVNTFEKYTEKGLAVNTIHSFQGDEKDIIIVSLVTDSPDKSKIYDDIRLLNVAITRSRFKLIIVGNANMASKKDDVSRMLKTTKDTAISMKGYFEINAIRPEVNDKLRKKTEKDVKFANEYEEIQKLKRNTYGKRW